jgi:hypothetical protein
MPRRSYRRSGRASVRAGIIALFLLVALFLILGRRSINLSFPGISGINGTSGTTGIGNIPGSNQCQSNCTVGSENISTQSLDQNRELGMLVSDSGVLNTLQQAFQQDWGDSQAVW